jgi:thiol-disulfide isomerase/thioredoxin
MVERRTFLGAAVSAGFVGSAGCLGVGGGDAGNEGGDGEGLERLDVAGSPGGTVQPLPAGEVALLDFWATWCAPCKPQMAELREIRERYPDVHMVSITNEDDREAIREFWREYEGTWSVAIDPEVRTNDRFDVTRIPTLLVFDADGTEVWRHVGLAAAEDIAAALEEAGATAA